MVKRLANLLGAFSDLFEHMGPLFSITLLAGLLGGTIAVYPRSGLVTDVTIGLLAVTACIATWWAVSAISRGDTKEERTRSFKGALPAALLFLQMALSVTVVTYLTGDWALGLVETHPYETQVAASIIGLLGLAWVPTGFEWLMKQIRSRPEAVHPAAAGAVEVTERRAPTKTLRYSEKDRKRVAAFFAGRVLCFASSPYVDEDFKVSITGEGVDITYHPDNQIDDARTVKWQLFQLLAGYQAELALAKPSSRVSWDQYGDIEHYAEKVLVSRAPGLHRVMTSPASESEAVWRVNRIRMLVKEEIPRVQMFLRKNRVSVQLIMKETLSGQISEEKLRLLLSKVHTDSLPQPWNESDLEQNPLRVISGSKK